MCSGELQKPVAGQPTVTEVEECVLRECRKESLVYKLAALHAAGEILEATQTDRFAELSQIIFPIIKKVLYINQCHLHTHLRQRCWNYSYKFLLSTSGIMGSSYIVVT